MRVIKFVCDCAWRTANHKACYKQSTNPDAGYILVAVCVHTAAPRVFHDKRSGNSDAGSEVILVIVSGDEQSQMAVLDEAAASPVEIPGPEAARNWNVACKKPCHGVGFMMFSKAQPGFCIVYG